MSENSPVEAAGQPVSKAFGAAKLRTDAEFVRRFMGASDPNSGGFLDEFSAAIPALIDVVEAAAGLVRAEDANSEAIHQLAQEVDDIGGAEERQRVTRAVGDLAWANLEAALAVFALDTSGSAAAEKDLS